MKIKKLFFTSLSLVFLSFNIAQAESCVRPTQPPASTCYKTVTTENQIDEDSKYIYIEKVSRQVPMNCGPSSAQIQYETDMVRYNVCLQINTMKDSGDELSTYSDSALHKQATASPPTYRQVCPYPSQPSSQKSQAIVDTASNAISTVKKYADGTFALFNTFQIYEWPATETDFNDRKQWEKDMDAIKQIADGTHPSQTAWNGNSLIKQVKTDIDIRSNSMASKQASIDKWLADKSNCPNATSQEVYDSIKGVNPLYKCPKGSGGVFSKDGSFTCRTYSKGCQLKHGENSWGDGEYCHICATGDVVNSTSNGCVPAPTIVVSSTPAIEKTVSITSTPKKQKLVEKLVMKESVGKPVTSSSSSSLPKEPTPIRTATTSPKTTWVKRVSNLLSRFHF